MHQLQPNCPSTRMRLPPAVHALRPAVAARELRCVERSMIQANFTCQQEVQVLARPFTNLLTVTRTCQHFRAHLEPRKVHWVRNIQYSEMESWRGESAPFSTGCKGLRRCGTIPGRRAKICIQNMGDGWQMPPQHTERTHSPTSGCTNAARSCSARKIGRTQQERTVLSGRVFSILAFPRRPMEADFRGFSAGTGPDLRVSKIRMEVTDQ